MALATMGTVLQTARELIGDVDITPSGEQFTDAKLLLKAQLAFRELNDLAVRYGLPDCERRIYRYLPAYRGFLDLNTTELEYSFDEPFLVEETGLLSRHKVDAVALIANSDDGRVSGNLKCTLDGTIQSTTFRIGSTGILHDVTGNNSLNGEWPVIAVVQSPPIEVWVNSPEAVGSPTLTHAYLAHASREWKETFPVDAITNVGPSLKGFQYATRHEYVWRVSSVEVPPSYLDRMFRLTAFVNFTAPADTTFTIWFESAEQFLGARTAALAIMDEAAGPDDASIPYAVELDMLARGKNRESDGSGGYLADWLEKNRMRRRKPPVAPPVARRG